MPDLSEASPEGVVQNPNTAIEAEPSSALVYLWPALAGILWGASTVAGRVAVLDLDPIVAATVRVAIAGLILIPLAIYYWRKGNRLSKGDWFLCAMLGLSGTAAFNLLFYVGLKLTTASEAAVITGATPAVTCILAALFIKESLTRWSVGGAILSLLGIALVVGAGLSLQEFSTDRAIGDGLVIISMLMWAVFNILTRLSMFRMSPMVVMVYSNLFGVVFLLPFGLWLIIMAGGVPAEPLTWVALVYAAIFSTIVGTALWNKGLKGAGASRIAVYGNLSPVTTLFLAAILLRETIGPVQILGAALVILGVLLTGKTSRSLT